MSKVLYQCATDLNGDGKECAFVDGNGKMWRLPFDVPTEFENEFMASKIIEHCHYYGIVEVHSTRDRSGVHYDMEDAKRRAQQALDASIDACINDYILNQMTDRVRQNFPPLPPQGRALECCIIRKYNLIKAGIRLIGWMPPYEMEDPGYGNTAIGTGTPSNIQEQMNQLQAQLLAQNALLLELLKGNVGKVTAAAGAAPPIPIPTPAPTVTPEISSPPASADEDAPDEYEADQRSVPTGIRL